MLRTSLALALTVPTLLGQQPTHDLRSTVKAGTALWFVESSEQSQQVDGDQRVGLRYERTFRVTVRKAEDDGDLIVVVDVARVRGTIDVPVLGSKPFDSADEARRRDPNANAGLGVAVSRMLESVEHDFIARVGVNGDVRAALVQLADGVGERDAATRAAHEHTLTRLCEAAFGELPDVPVAVGAEWQYRRGSPPGGLPTRQRGKVQLKSVDDRRCVLALTGKLERRPPGKHDLALDFVVEQGEVTGEQTISRRTGMTDSATMTARARLRLRTPDGDRTTRLTLTTTLRQVPAPKPAAAGATGGGQPDKR